MELNHGDITNIMVIIDLASQRGVFKAPELAPIGKLYEKLNSIHKELTAKNQSEQTSAENR